MEQYINKLQWHPCQQGRPSSPTLMGAQMVRSSRQSLGRFASKPGVQTTPWAILKQEFTQNERKQSITSMTSWPGLPTPLRVASPLKPPSPPAIQRKDEYIPVQPQQDIGISKVEPPLFHRDEEFPPLPNRGQSKSGDVPEMQEMQEFEAREHNGSSSSVNYGNVGSMSSQSSVWNGRNDHIKPPCAINTEDSLTGEEGAYDAGPTRNDVLIPKVEPYVHRDEEYSALSCRGRSESRDISETNGCTLRGGNGFSPAVNYANVRSVSSQRSVWNGSSDHIKTWYAINTEESSAAKEEADIPGRTQEDVDIQKVETYVHQDEEYPPIPARGLSQSRETTSTERTRSRTWTEMSRSSSRDGHGGSMSSQSSVWSSPGRFIEAQIPFDSQCPSTPKEEAPTKPPTTSKLRAQAKPWTMPNRSTPSHVRPPLDSSTLFTPPPAMTMNPWQGSLRVTTYYSHFNMGPEYARHVGNSVYAPDVSVFAVPVEPLQSDFPQSHFQYYGTHVPTHVTSGTWTANDNIRMTLSDPTQDWQEWADEVALSSSAHDESESISEQFSDWNCPSQIEFPDTETFKSTSSGEGPGFPVSSRLPSESGLNDMSLGIQESENEKRLSRWLGVSNTSLGPPAASVETVKPFADSEADAVPATPEQPIAFDTPSSPPVSPVLKACGNDGSEKYGIALTAPMDPQFRSPLMKDVKTVQKPIGHGRPVSVTARTEGNVVKTDMVQDIPILMKGVRARLWSAVVTDGNQSNSTLLSLALLTKSVLQMSEPRLNPRSMDR